MTVLERHGLLQRAEPLEEIKRLKKKAQARLGAGLRGVHEDGNANDS